jgi:mono/diheme cytochrome c family protein
VTYLRTLGVLVGLAVALSACGKGAPNAVADDGDEIFRTACVRCHGPDGTGGPPDPLGNPGPRNFTERSFQTGITDERIRGTIQNGKRGMPAFGAVFTPSQLDKLVARVRAFGPPPRDASAPPAPAGTR